MPPKSRNPINLAYGVLNHVNVPEIQRRAGLQGGKASTLIRSTIEEAYSPDAILGTGPYKAICLRIEEQPTKPQVGSWLSDFFGDLFSGDDKLPTLVMVKARIPEIHAMFPIPATLGNHSQHHNIIDLYPTFIAKSEDIKLSEPGALVWVDFGNKANFTDPIYLGPVVTTNVVPGTVGSVTAKGVHDNACLGEPKMKVPDGDVLSGKNIPLSHTGLPLLRRGIQVSRENKMINGSRFDANVVFEWNKALEKNNAFGITHIGTSEYNGNEDTKHSRGKRSTIIYAPNTTNFAEEIELIYYFHGDRGFNNSYEFEKRLVKSTKELQSMNRNFVLVVPEMPWSKDTAPNQRDAWEPSSGDDFSKFHQETKNILIKNFSSKVKIGFTTLVGFSMGGKAIANAANTSALDKVNPDKITFAEASFYKWTEEVWVNHARSNEKTEFNILTRRGSTLKNARRFASNFSTEVAIQKRIRIEELVLTTQRIGDDAILYINPSVGDRDRQTDIVALSEKDIPPPDTQEGPAPDAPKSNQQEFPTTPLSKFPAATNAPVSPSVISKRPGFDLEPSERFKEARVNIRDYEPLDIGSSLLVRVPSTRPGVKLHTLAAKRLLAMNEQWIRDNPKEEPLLIRSGWRTKKDWSRAEYEAFLIKEYGSVERGRKIVAFASPHTTGLAMDFGNNGLFPNSKTNARQKKTHTYKWLVNNAHKYGITPYKYEAWHWEVRLPRESWASGQEFTDDLNVRVASVGVEKTLPQSDGTPLQQQCVATLGSLAEKGKA